jgi:L-malate glycosyltransferase
MLTESFASLDRRNPAEDGVSSNQNDDAGPYLPTAHLTAANGRLPLPAPQGLRVGFVLHAMQVAGAEVLVAETIRRLGTRIDPTVFCLDAVGPLGEQLRAQGVPVICLGRQPGIDWQVPRRLAREARARRIEVLHAHQYGPFFYASLARLLALSSVRLILTEHGRHYPDVVSPFRRAVNRLCFDHLADAVNAVCAFSGRSLVRVDGFAGRRITVIENGIELERYHPASDRAGLRRRLNLNPERVYVTTVARFHPVKDHATLLRAFQLVATARPDVDLLLAGDGPLRETLKQQVRAQGFEERVHFLGVRLDVPQLLRASDVFALTSVSEAASLTLLEAMATALPVVVTDVGGNPEIVRQGIDGFLVPRGDAAAAAAALLRLLEDPSGAAAMGAAGRARVARRYRLQQTVESYWHLYQQLCPRKGCASFPEFRTLMSPPLRNGEEITS